MTVTKDGKILFYKNNIMNYNRHNFKKNSLKQPYLLLINFIFVINAQEQADI